PRLLPTAIVNASGDYQKHAPGSASCDRIARHNSEISSPWGWAAQAAVGGSGTRGAERGIGNSHSCSQLPRRRIGDRIDRAARIPHFSSESGGGPWSDAPFRTTRSSTSWARAGWVWFTKPG